jgi:hypothetical protein
VAPDLARTTLKHSYFSLYSFEATIAVSKAIQLLKAGSSLGIHQTFPKLRTFSWQQGYGAFSVGISQIPNTIRYIEQQLELLRSVATRTQPSSTDKRFPAPVPALTTVPRICVEVHAVAIAVHLPGWAAYPARGCGARWASRRFSCACIGPDVQPPHPFGWTPRGQRVQNETSSQHAPLLQ